MSRRTETTTVVVGCRHMLRWLIFGCCFVPAKLVAAAAQIQMTEIQIERSRVRASVDGEVLQVKVHSGKFAPAGLTATLSRVAGAVPLWTRPAVAPAIWEIVLLVTSEHLL